MSVEIVIEKASPRQIIEAKLVYQRDKKVDIMDIDILLDREDKIRKYSRNSVFWYFADLYYKEDNPNADEETIRIAGEIIKEEHQKSINQINEKFRDDGEMKSEIFSRIEQYKWKEENYGNPRKKSKAFISLY